MTPRVIDRFFLTLAREFDGRATLIVTGAAAGALWGHARPSRDIDFSVQVPGGAAQWTRLEAALARTVERTGIQVNYAEDIDRWSSVTLLDYRRHTAPYKTFGRMTVRLLAPAYWAIGKLARYFELDVDDLVRVLRRNRVPAAPAIRLWARALRASPRSAALPLYRRQVEHFLGAHGRAIWGRSFDPEAAVRRFRRVAAGGAR